MLVLIGIGHVIGLNDSKTCFLDAVLSGFHSPFWREKRRESVVAAWNKVHCTVDLFLCVVEFFFF